MSHLFPNLYKKLKQFKKQNFPLNFLTWIKQIRPNVEGYQRSFLSCPFWEEIYRIPLQNMMIMGGRQTFKSTFITDYLAYYATAYPNSTVIFVTFDNTNRDAFSNQKFRRGCLEGNPILRNSVGGFGLGNVKQITFKNGSVVYLLTDEGKYSQIEGKSPTIVLFDESQYQDLENLPIVLESLTMTKGKIIILGIGGESGSEYERKWLSSTQSQWVYDNPNWRDNLKFKNDGSLIVGTYLKKVLKGRWNAKNPGSKFLGFYLPQSIFPQIPLTEEDAIKRYHLLPEQSIQGKKRNYTSSMYLTHVEGTFYKSSRRPITREDVLACMRPYRDYFLLSGKEVRELKELYGREISIYMGIDWGSSSKNNSSTVVSIIIKWRRESEDSARFYLAHIEERGQERTLEQAQYMANLFREYSCDFGVADLGYGETQVDAILNGGHNPKTGEYFEGLGRSQFIGCRTISSLTKPFSEVSGKIDEEGEELDRIQVDKTHIMQMFVDFICTFVSHPKFYDNENYRRPKFMIPYAENWKVDWLVKEFTSISRKDIEKNLDITLDDPRQHPKKEFYKPPDSVMSIIYCLLADETYSPSSDFAGIWKQTRQ